MAELKPKGEFWKTAKAAPCEGGYAVMILDRPLQTPAKHAFIAPRAVAEAAAAEWRAQEAKVEPSLMPLTRSVNTAIDRVSKARDATIEAIAAYGASDLLCYRATGPEGLVEEQARQWDKLLAWCAAQYGARLITVSGINYQQQPAQSLKALEAPIKGQSDLGLTALYDLTAISGSLVLGLAVLEQRLSADAAFDISRLDEDWQARHWGEDAQAIADAARRRQAMQEAAALLALLREE